MKRPFSRWLALLILPVAFVAGAARLARDRGPLWLGLNSDPSYQYLFNSLLLLNGQPPAHVDHPGTPVQALGAFTLDLTQPGPDTVTKSLAALQDPERALAAIHAVLLALAGLTLAGGAILVAESTGSWAMGLALQLVPVAELEAWRGSLYVAPEALLVPLTVAFVALLIARDLPADPAPPQKSTTLLSVAIGLVAGAALATKVTFLPLWLLPLFTARSRRAAGWTLLSALVGAGVFISPAASQLPRMLVWFGRLASHTGMYGAGGTGVIDPATYLPSLGRLLIHQPVLIAIELASVVVGTLAALGRSRRYTRETGRFLLSATAVQILAVALVAKHPHAHYLLPTLLSLAFNLACFLRAAPRPNERTMQRLVAAPAAAVAACLVVIGALRTTTLAANLARDRDAQLAASRQADAVTRDGVQVDYYRCASLPFALYFGNESAWRMFGAPLSRLYPGHIFFNAFTGTLDTYTGHVDRNVVLKLPRVYLVGGDLIEHLPPEVPRPVPVGGRLRLVARGECANVYAIQPSPGPASPSPRR